MVKEQKSNKPFYEKVLFFPSNNTDEK